MTSITELGYIGISVSDAEAWKHYATRVLGMELFDDGETDRFYLRMDRWHHRIVVHTQPAGDPDDLAYIGWRVADSAALRSMAAKLEAAGVPFRVGTRQEAQERRVLGLLKLGDPAGNPTEIFYSPQVDAHKPFHPGRPLFGGFKTGSHGMGHLIIRQTDEEAAQRFYALLGFVGDVEYRLRLPEGPMVDITFVHCNERQHSLGWMLGGSPKRLGHFMFNYEHFDDLGQTHDMARKHGMPIAATLGKHGNDQAYSFYMGNPSRWLIEPGWGGLEASGQQEHFLSDIFGHDLEVGEMVGNMKFKAD